MQQQFAMTTWVLWDRLAVAHASFIATLPDRERSSHACGILDSLCVSEVHRSCFGRCAEAAAIW